MPHYAVVIPRVPNARPDARSPLADVAVDVQTRDEASARAEVAAVLTRAWGLATPEAAARAAAARLELRDGPVFREWTEHAVIATPRGADRPVAAAVWYRTRYVGDVGGANAVRVVVVAGSVGDPVLARGVWPADVAARARVLAARLRDDAHRGTLFTKRARPGGGYGPPERAPHL